MHKLLSLTLIALALLTVSATAQSTKSDPYVTLDVFASQTAIAKGETINIAIRQNIFDGWHTYWVNAGDSGEPISITWDLPKGISMGEINHPTPKKISYDPLVNFGHYGNPIFTQTLSVSNDFQGNTITLNGDAFWLVCDDICIPEQQKISITLPIRNGEKANEDIFNLADKKSPEVKNWNSQFSIQNGEFSLTVDIPVELHNQFTDTQIFPFDWGMIQTTSDIMADISDNTVTFIGTAGDRNLSTVTDNRFVLKTTNNAYIIDAENTESVVSEYADTSLLLILAFAFVGGLILNLMPCVFPVLSMKALSLIKLSDKEKSHARKSGIAYTAGIVLSFLVIAGSLLIFKNAGETIGWGFQLQNPYVVTILATLLFVIGLNLLGLFEFTSRFSNVGSKLTTGNDVKSSFFTGVLATLVATPCTAPFMASAIGYALTQSAFVSMSVFAMLGFGLAFPYLLLTYVPAVQKIMPRPGVWMDTFKQALSWPMFISAIWLVWVLIQQSGDMATLYILGLFLAIIFIIWFGQKTSSKLWRIIVIAALTATFFIYSPLLAPQKDTLGYEAFKDQSQLQKILDDNPNQPVFVNMTAAWCITCLVNERTSLSQDNVKQAFDDNNVRYIKGDWTNQDENITKYLESHGRNGVPLYVLYHKADDNGQRPKAQLLPQILTPNIVLNAIKGDI